MRHSEGFGTLLMTTDTSNALLDPFCMGRTQCEIRSAPLPTGAAHFFVDTQVRVRDALRFERRVARIRARRRAIGPRPCRCQVYECWQQEINCMLNPSM